MTVLLDLVLVPVLLSTFQNATMEGTTTIGTASTGNMRREDMGIENHISNHLSRMGIWAENDRCEV